MIAPGNTEVRNQKSGDCGGARSERRGRLLRLGPLLTMREDAPSPAQLAPSAARAWAQDGAMDRLYDMLAIWRERGRNITGKGMPSGHNMQEGAPDEVLAELRTLPARADGFVMRQNNITIGPSRGARCAPPQAHVPQYVWTEAADDYLGNAQPPRLNKNGGQRAR